MFSPQKIISGLLISLLLAACANMSAVFSEHAYQQAVSLKVESLELIGHASEPYVQYAQAVDQLNTKLRKAYQYALGRPNNEITARQWEILINPDRNLLGGFLARWKEKGSLSAVFVEENKKIIAAAFNTIIELESGKIKPSALE